MTLSGYKKVTPDSSSSGTATSPEADSTAAPADDTGPATTELPDQTNKLREISGWYAELPGVAPRTNNDLRDSICFRCRLLLQPEVDAVISIMPGDDNITYVTLIPNVVHQQKSNLTPTAYNRIIEDDLRNWLLGVIKALIVEGDYLQNLGIGKEEILGQLCPWYGELRSATEAATDFANISWFNWTSLDRVIANQRSAHAARKAKAREMRDSYRPNPNQKEPNGQQINECIARCRKMAIEVATAATARQAERTAIQPAAKAASTA